MSWVSRSHRPEPSVYSTPIIENKADACVDNELTFETAWSSRPEKGYVHWTRGKPKNQVQLAFRNHWELFCEIMGRRRGEGLRSLEVGCGRGSLSCYFSDAGYDTHLLDYSRSVLDTAKSIFFDHSLTASFIQADAGGLPYDAGAFDVVFSIGLLEHFEPIFPLLSEQVRVLKPGGFLFVYAVPEKRIRVQEEFEWINNLLKDQEAATTEKTPLYRNTVLCPEYVEVLDELGLDDLQSSGVYSLPMISTSPEFPFTIMTPECERILVERFTDMLDRRRRMTGGHPWLCDEDYGQALLVWGKR